MNSRTPARALWRLLAALAAFSLIAAACGDSDDTTPAQVDTTAAAETTEAMSAEMSDDDMADDDTAEMSADDEMSDMDMDATEGGHSHGEAFDVDDATAPTIDVVLVDDPAGGWNLRLETTNFRFAPENVSTDHVDGEGHAHLYIDGERHGRIYGEWYQVPGLTEGEHTLRVELSTNDHRTYAVDGEPVDDSVTVTVMAADASDDAHADHSDEGHGDEGHDHDSAEESSGDAAGADVVIEIEIVDGSVVGGVEQVAIPIGSTVALVVTADIDEELHVHGYDVFAELTAGVPGTLVFEARIPGVFEAELEGRGQRIVDLEIS